ncbi:hypothetical protein RO3G_08441 [Rhizopus delemar RA 99-880]|uniref:Uncharacterized protein n=1 Tax=Rhizopus delemar (strain RA 99-880 / ATCC MYA-4621 / FGSC 9543 / NRRL 43880) TaxID=246409 RepID=I1C5K6_RHIO9|nr:hypothetical protein RO3G_08441 [Rhizopus delemar RA 99-880]|eukprot:EIE83736.1 hypothetical protein RO3G_08441 [Rhizopus delemar RA 99-880]
MEVAAGSPTSTMNTFGSLDPVNRILAAKCSVDGIVWNPFSLPQLERFINVMHNPTAHA